MFFITFLFIRLINFVFLFISVIIFISLLFIFIRHRCLFFSFFYDFLSFAVFHHGIGSLKLLYFLSLIILIHHHFLFLSFHPSHFLPFTPLSLLWHSSSSIFYYFVYLIFSHLSPSSLPPIIAHLYLYRHCGSSHHQCYSPIYISLVLPHLLCSVNVFISSISHLSPSFRSSSPSISHSHLYRRYGTSRRQFKSPISLTLTL